MSSKKYSWSKADHPLRQHLLQLGQRRDAHETRHGRWRGRDRAGTPSRSFIALEQLGQVDGPHHRRLDVLRLGWAFLKAESPPQSDVHHRNGSVGRVHRGHQVQVVGHPKAF
jgi:hypothetical protein